MKKLLFFLSFAALFVCLVACGDKEPNEPTLHDNYFIANGEKVLITRDNTRAYILFENRDTETVIRKLADIGAEARILPFTTYAENPNDYLIECSEAIVDASYDEVSNIVELIYAAPFYKDSEGYKICITCEILVMFKGKTDLGKLEKLAERNDMLFLGRSTGYSEWYTFACTENSKGNSLQMANLLYETGLFSSSSPNMIVETILVGL